MAKVLFVVQLYLSMCLVAHCMDGLSDRQHKRLEQVRKAAMDTAGSEEASSSSTGQISKAARRRLDVVKKAGQEDSNPFVQRWAQG